MRSTNLAAVLLYFATAGHSTPVGKPHGHHLPVVDLGYELHRALDYDATTDAYTFQNVRYARNPTGDLRFRAPQEPLTNRSAVQTGSEPRTCPQGIPAWQIQATAAIKKFTGPGEFNLTEWEEAIANGHSDIVPFPGVTEDCLFLDVHVPRKVYQKRHRARHHKHGAPVLVFIHGGGYTLGSKLGFPNQDYYPSGLMEHAREEDKDGMIVVSINYRLGAFGFLAGEEVKKDGDLNAGILDQRFALDWIQKNIHLFGGSRDKVTAMGESAGGGSIVLHMAAYGGKHHSTPFSQAIPQSPAVLPTFEPIESAFDDFMALLNVTNIHDARKLPEEALVKANTLQIGNTAPTSYNFYPVVDGKYIKEPVFSQIAKGGLDKSVKVMSGHNSFEGGFFFDPTVKSEEDFRSWIDRSIAGLSDSQIDYLANDLYPPQYDGSLGYVDIDTRQGALWGEAVLDCTYAITNEAFKGHSYSYEFAVTPGIHTQDLTYTFSGRNTTVPYPETQNALQQAIASFAMTGKPTFSEDGKKARSFPKYGRHESVVVFTENEQKVGHNSVNATRCAWWKNYVLIN